MAAAVRSPSCLEVEEVTTAELESARARQELHRGNGLESLQTKAHMMRHNKMAHPASHRRGGGLLATHPTAHARTRTHTRAAPPALPSPRTSTQASNPSPPWTSARHHL